MFRAQLAYRLKTAMLGRLAQGNGSDELSDHAFLGQPKMLTAIFKCFA